MNSYFKSFLKKNKNIFFSTARAGNVVGGGDWSKNRLIPDIIKSFMKNKKVLIKNPNSVRPWQHVMEPIFGYMLLAKKLYGKSLLNGQSFNFGPHKEKNFKVVNIVNQLSKLIKKKNFYNIKKKNFFQETKLLRLISDKSYKILGWKTVLSMRQVISLILEWYTDYFNKQSQYKITLKQIKDYENIVLK